MRRKEVIGRTGRAAARSVRSSPDEGGLRASGGSLSASEEEPLSQLSTTDRSMEVRLLVTELTVMCQGPWVGRVSIRKKFHAEMELDEGAGSSQGVADTS